MRSVIPEGISIETFYQRAMVNNYALQEGLIDPTLVEDVSKELAAVGLLRDKVELQSTDDFSEKRMTAATLLHKTLSTALSDVLDVDGEYLPYFSVRVFEPGEHATTIHRNHPAIRPWAIGITLRGEAPFSVYEQSLLPIAWHQTIPLVGGGLDPTPKDSFTAGPGSAWALYTETEQTPHSGGLVDSEEQRELLILYTC